MNRSIDHLIKALSELKTNTNGLEAIALADAEDILYSEHYVGTLSRDIYSHTKSFFAMALGIALNEGRLKLSDRLCDYYPEYAEKPHDPAIEQITLEHLITMTAGFNHTYLHRRERRIGIGMPDYMTFMFSLKTDTVPGSTFSYTSAQSFLAGRMLAKAIDEPLRLYTYRTLFKPMGIGYPIWECEPGGEVFCGSGLFLSVEDQIKLGQLCLSEGAYQGRQLVPVPWIREATSKKVDTGKSGFWDVGYGYQFWTASIPDAYCARGAFGQNTYILPHENLTIAFQTSEVNSDFSQVEQRVTELLLD